jgi:uncharacterized protein involved in exopolysaccharide biosynthesis
MVRYVVDHSIIDDVDSMRGVTTNGLYDDSVINDEMEILTSWDLAMEVAEAVSAENAAVPDAAKAQAPALAGQIHGNLTVVSRKGSNVIAISYKDANPAQAFRILQELLKRYYERHLQVHRSANSVELTDEVLNAKNELMKTEEDLRNLRTTSGILSLTDSTTSLGAAMARSEDEYHAAETELREQSARVEALQGVLVGTAPKESEDAKAQLASEVVRLKTLEARGQRIKELLDHYKEAAMQLAKLAPKLQELERTRELQEANYSKLERKLERARIDERLRKDSSRLPNISVVQQPSPPVRL